MKRPKWVTLIGVLGIICGVGGVFNAITTTVVGAAFQSQIKTEGIIYQAAAPTQESAAEQYKRTAIRWGIQHKWFGPGCVVLGLISLAFSALYISAAILLLQLKSFAPTFFKSVLCLSITCGISRAVLFAKSSVVFGPVDFRAAVTGITINTVVLAILVMGHKFTFSNKVSA
jgi:hypothetical protein